jgi:orotidine 5'-phosphate decarboxylase subfamily 1/orotate phosphoribosyltransferase
MSQNYITSLKNVLFSKLYYLEIIKYGTFTLKNGSISNIYIDLKKLINYPSVFSLILKLIKLIHPTLLLDENIKLMSIPMGGLPLGNYISFSENIPQIMVRDKVKEHGIRNLIEGIITPLDKYIIIEDVITSGTSVKETLKILQYQQFTYQAILCICNRGNIHSIMDIPILNVFTIDELMQYLDNVRKIPTIPQQYFKIGNYFSNQLYYLAIQKKSNLILSCDFMSIQNIIKIIEKLGHYIVAVKLHLDTLNEYSTNSESLNQLLVLQTKYNFMIIEDSKFGDIETIMLDKITSILGTGIDALTIHALSGLSILTSHKLNNSITPIIVTEMSCNNLIDDAYPSRVIQTIRTQVKPNLGGLICQSKVPQILEPFEMLTMSPGINFDSKHDDSNQNYTIPNVKHNKLGLFWIVGRGITKYLDNEKILIEKTQIYTKKGWDYFIQY